MSGKAKRVPPGVTVAYHFGPSREHVGGMASVIATLVDLGLGADIVRGVATWRPGSHTRSGLLAGRAAARVLGLPASTVVHVHLSAGGSFVREAAILACAQLRGLPRVVTIHSGAFVPFSARWPGLVSRVLRMATAITVLSEESAEIARAMAPAVHVELLPNPIEFDRGAGPASETAELVLFAGKVGRPKGADVLYRAWETVSASRPLATCLVVGPPADVLLPPPKRLEVRGPVSPMRVRELIREARVVVLPSRGEGLPMVLAEAMAAGRPFVSTAVGGVTALAEGGILVPVDDDQALAAALIEVLSEPMRAQALGEAGQALCKRWMAPKAVDVRLRALYRMSRGRATSGRH